MINNNLRHAIRTILGTGAFPDYTDINGYTGSDTTNDNYGNSAHYAFSSYFTSTFSNVPLSAILTGSAQTTSNIKSPFAILGNQADGESEYSLGEFMEPGFLISSNNSNSNYKLLAVTTITNPTNASKTYNEVGLFGCYTANYSVKWNNQNKTVPFMYIKEVLQEPITVPAGSSVTVIFDLFANVVSVESE